MKTVTCWNDLQAYGIYPLTGEACGLGYRILFDVDARGKRILEVCFGIPGLNLPESWNRGSENDPHVGAIMLSREALVPLAAFALLENGCTEVYLVGDTVVGIEAGDPPDMAERMLRARGVEYARRLAYQGTARDRNIHQMTGRIV